MKKLPAFNVLYEDFNSNNIVYKNFFEFGQWEVIKKELKKLKSAIAKADTEDKIIDVYRKFGIKYGQMKARFKKKDPTVSVLKDALEQRLDRSCLYYFWSKCEYEVIVSAWPPREHSERKIDIYTQLGANWEIFKNMVFAEIGV